jgi:uncharacterized protein (DUF362 family)
MKSRREFLKQTAAGAMIFGSSAAADKLRLVAMPSERKEAAASKVVVARDPSLQSTQMSETRVLDLLDRAVVAYTGQERPLDAWKHIAAQRGSVDGTIGLKTNGLGGRGISTHAVLIHAVSERLQQAGVKPGNIIIWDRNARDLNACGLTISTDSNGVRCFGSDVIGFEDHTETWASARVRFSKILTRECAMVINLPILKDHSMAGLTFAMKNMYGVVESPWELHANGCNPGVADLNAMPAVRQKVRYTIGDALSSVYHGGPGFHPQYLWYPNAIVVGEDCVAIDTVAWQMLERKRSEAGLPSLAAEGRAPHYIGTAADAAHNLGANDLKRIHLVEI